MNKFLIFSIPFIALLSSCGVTESGGAIGEPLARQDVFDSEEEAVALTLDPLANDISFQGTIVGFTQGVYGTVDYVSPETDSQGRTTSTLISYTPRGTMGTYFEDLFEVTIADGSGAEAKSWYTVKFRSFGPDQFEPDGFPELARDITQTLLPPGLDRTQPFDVFLRETRTADAFNSRSTGDVTDYFNIVGVTIGGDEDWYRLYVPPTITDYDRYLTLRTILPQVNDDNEKVNPVVSVLRSQDPGLVYSTTGDPGVANADRSQLSNPFPLGPLVDTSGGGENGESQPIEDDVDGDGRAAFLHRLVTEGWYYIRVNPETGTMGEFDMHIRLRDIYVGPDLVPNNNSN